MPSQLGRRPGVYTVSVRFEVSVLEQELVDAALRIVAETSCRYSTLMPTKVQCHPLPFFGSLDRARVITLGLNPSTHEFTRQRNWPRHLTAAELADQVVNYWTANGRSPHPWFRAWSTVLSEMGISYSLDAAHLDLSPRATNSRKSTLRALFISMLQTDAPVWIEALCRAPKCSLVLAAGSATKGGYINEFISEMLPQTGVRLLGTWRRKRGEGQTASHTISLPGGREIPLFFCSTGPTQRSGTVLVNACRANMSTLKQILSAATI